MCIALKLQFSSFHFPVSLYFSHDNIEGVGTRTKFLKIAIVSISEGGRPESRDRERHQRNIQTVADIMLTIHFLERMIRG
jgi:hypothetical protein